MPGLELETPKMIYNGEAKRLLKKMANADPIIRKTLLAVGQEVRSKSRQKYLRGPRSKTRLGVVSGTLIRSLSIDQSHLPEKLSVGTSLVYGAVHEYGATIRAKHKPYLVFKPRGANHFVRKKQVRIPARPFLRPAVDDVFPSRAHSLSLGIIRKELRL